MTTARRQGFWTDYRGLELTKGPGWSVARGSQVQTGVNSATGKKWVRLKLVHRRKAFLAVVSNLGQSMVNEMKKEQKEVGKCEFCEETFETEEQMTLHVNHAHYRDTYKAVDRERRNWAKQCLARSVDKFPVDGNNLNMFSTREYRRKPVGRKELEGLMDDEDRDPDYQEE